MKSMNEIIKDGNDQQISLIHCLYQKTIVDVAPLEKDWFDLDVCIKYLLMKRNDV